MVLVPSRDSSLRCAPFSLARSETVTGVADPCPVRGKNRQVTDLARAPGEPTLTGSGSETHVAGAVLEGARTARSRTWLERRNRWLLPWLERRIPWLDQRSES